jgi:cyclic beta-1,2-glucan synthetase
MNPDYNNFDTNRGLRTHPIHRYRAEECPSESDSYPQNAAFRTTKENPSIADGKPSRVLKVKWNKVSSTIQHALLVVNQCPAENRGRSDLARWALESKRHLSSILWETHEFIKSARLGQIESSAGPMPRVYVAAEAFLSSSDFNFEDQQLKTYFNDLQAISLFTIAELWAIRPMLQLILLERIASFMSCLSNSDFLHKTHMPKFSRSPGPSLLSMLIKLGEVDWNLIVEELSAVHRILCLDLHGAYLQMDFESRNRYRAIVQEIASRSPCSEAAVARSALELTRAAARESPQFDSDRRSHVGYFLTDRGRFILEQRVGYHPRWTKRFLRLASKKPGLFYFSAVSLLTALPIVLAVAKLFSFATVSVASVLLLIPASECALQIANLLFPFLYPPRVVPSLDYSSGIPSHSSTIVVVPAILSDADQAQLLVRELEVRYLGNRDPNLHFALVTDFPDSPSPIGHEHPLVSICSTLVADLDSRYRHRRTGRFFHFHRRQVYNPHHRKWMGWERKRGKLLDFNALLRGDSSAFPVQVGDLSILSQIKYVITLDSDTRLPLNSARCLVATIAHPLNRAVLDTKTNTVKEGYGVVQPRIAVSTHSACRSRFARIFSGNTGFDIYTSAVSNIYQDLWGEGTFTGKGIYDVDIFQSTVGKTFPSNLILSHDLLEGAYARTALVSQIELIDDYPSRFGTFARRKHRWVRGDWQTLFWMFPWVPGHSGGWVSNPISLISRWKILDNLRRSLLEIAMMVLLLAGWSVLPGGAVYWTTVVLALFFIPAFVQFSLSLLKKGCKSTEDFRGTCHTFFSDLLHACVSLALLAGQAVVAADAIGRSLWRLAITRRDLLDWETFAHCDSQALRTGLPHIALRLSCIASCLLGSLMIFHSPRIPFAVFALMLPWLCAGLLCDWLDQPLPSTGGRINQSDRHLLRETALRTWIFFRTFSNPQTHWLLPDNVWEDAACSSRTSATNIGLLLTSRIVAHEMGYMCVEEFLFQTEMTLTTLVKLPKYRGHFFNWYDISTLQPEQPLFISTVDSGNLAASFLTLKQYCLALGKQPASRARLWEGLNDYLRIVFSLLPSSVPAEIRELESFLKLRGDPQRQDLQTLRTILTKLSAQLDDQLIETRELRWSIAETLSRTTSLLHGQRESQSAVEGDPQVAERLLRIAEQLDSLASQMDFSFLYCSRKGALSVGYHYVRRTLHESHYDLLASEARTALFIAIAKGDLPPKLWFSLGRAHTRFHNKNVLLSWAGSMFEYVMPNLWMKMFPGTLLEKTARAVVMSQMMLSRTMKLPWGFSESACSQLAHDGAYEYIAFGVPELSLRPFHPEVVAISPYSSFLALLVDAQSALKNIRSMKMLNWFGRFGFYEAAVAHPKSDFKPQEGLVRCWMAHHQGMIILSIYNLFSNFKIQDLFHSELMITATERLLEEKLPVSIHVRRLHQTLAFNDKALWLNHPRTPQIRHSFDSGSKSFVQKPER